MALIIVIIVLVCCSPLFYMAWCYFDPLKTTEKKQQKGKNEREEEIRPSWEILKKKYEERKKYYESKENFKSKDGNLYIFENNKLFKLNPVFNLDSYVKYSGIELPTELEEIIEFDKVKYYNITGSEREQQIISGGGGGGSSVGGAIVGGLVAGDVGAIIGSRKKVQEVTTTYEKVDDRKLVITFQNGGTQTFYDFDLYEFLLSSVPEKDYENYIENLKSNGKD